MDPKTQSLERIFGSSAKDLVRNPFLFIPPIFLLVFLLLISQFFIWLNYQLSTTLLLSISLVLAALISLSLLSFIFSGMISISALVINKKKLSFKDFFSSAKKYWLKNLVIMIVIILAYNLVRFLAHYLGLFLGSTFSLELKAAQLVFYLIYFLGLATLITGLTFSSFFLVIKNRTILQSLKSSILLVKSNYLQTLTIIVVFFVISQLLGFLPIILSELLSTIVVLPYLSLVLSRFLLSTK